ncbi:hypothetical protein [Bradyrhizobium sp. AZCC 1614]|uniref:hypothetical protein n=1 Tax=Bradyrhizobium sp. AZCC 1614 TaxID=3117017 RepID=UPI002FF3F5F0
MTEASNKLRRLGLAAVFVLAASGAAAQLQEFSTGQRNLACGSPATIGDGWPTATPESVGLDGRAAVRHRGATCYDQCQRSCSGDRPPRHTRVRAIFSGL